MDKTIKIFEEEKMGETLFLTITNLFTKTGLVLSNIWGWVGVILMSVITFFAPLQVPLYILTALVFTDLALGVWINRKKILSSKLRLTVVKYFIYIMLISSLYAIETVVEISLLWKIMFAICSVVELWSISGNLLVIFPNIPILKLFRSVLKSEIDKKIGETGVTDITSDDLLNEKTPSEVKDGENNQNGSIN